jgi:heme exporter protein C
MFKSLPLFTFAAPSKFYNLASALTPWLYFLFFSLALSSLYIGFLVAPTDATQGDVYRIIFTHVPAAWMSMVLYISMAFWSAIGLAFNARLAHMVSRAIAPTGAIFTLIALLTGSIWGKPTWGTWWVWDARLTSELILLFLYLGYIALAASIDDVKRGDKASALLSIVGVINVPIIYFSVKWWNTLHQGATISMIAAPKMASTMLMSMSLMTFAFWAYAFAVVFTRTRAIILEREKNMGWVQFLGTKIKRTKI